MNKLSDIMIRRKSLRSASMGGTIMGERLEMVDETGVVAAGESSETGVTVRRVMSWSDRIRPTSSIGDAMR